MNKDVWLPPKELRNLWACDVAEKNKDHYFCMQAVSEKPDVF